MGIGEFRDSLLGRGLSVKMFEDHPMRARNWCLALFACVLIGLFSVTSLLLPSQPVSGTADAWDWTTRDTWQRPQEVMDALELQSGSAVADVGCGDGYFTFHLADRVGPSGRVYAVDIKEDVIQKIRQSAEEKKLPQIIAIVGSVDDPHLAAGSLDAILVVKAYHEFSQYDKMLSRFLEALRPGGRLAVIDYIAEPGKPRSEYMQHHRIPPQLVQQEVERDGFHFLRREADLPIPDDSRILFFLLFDRPPGELPRQPS
jgi:predicted methyltransferase